MQVKTKFAICYAVIAVLVVVAAGLGYWAHDLKQQVDSQFKSKSAPVVAQTVVASANQYFTTQNSDARATAAVCVTTATPTQYTCTLTLTQPSTGKTAQAKYTVTYSNGQMTNIAAAK